MLNEHVNFCYLRSVPATLYIELQLAILCSLPQYPIYCNSAVARLTKRAIDWCHLLRKVALNLQHFNCASKFSEGCGGRAGSGFDMTAPWSLIHKSSAWLARKWSSAGSFPLVGPFIRSIHNHVRLLRHINLRWFKLQLPVMSTIKHCRFNVGLLTRIM